MKYTFSIQNKERPSCAHGRSIIIDTDLNNTVSVKISIKIQYGQLWRVQIINTRDVRSPLSRRLVHTSKVRLEPRPDVPITLNNKIGSFFFSKQIKKTWTGPIFEHFLKKLCRLSVFKCVHLKLVRTEIIGLDQNWCLNQTVNDAYKLLWY